MRRLMKIGAARPDLGGRETIGWTGEQEALSHGRHGRTRAGWRACKNLVQKGKVRNPGGHGLYPLSYNRPVYPARWTTFSGPFGHLKSRVVYSNFLPTAVKQPQG